MQKSAECLEFIRASERSNCEFKAEQCAQFDGGGRFGRMYTFLVLFFGFYGKELAVK